LKTAKITKGDIARITLTNITITQCQKNFADCVMVKFEFFKL